MKRYAIIAIFLATLNGVQADPDPPAYPVTVDVQNQRERFDIYIHQADTPLVRVFTKQSGAKWQPTTNWHGLIAYGTNYEQSTTLALIDGTPSTVSNYFDFAFDASECGSNGLFFCQIALTNSANGKRVVMSDGLMHIAKNPLGGAYNPFIWMIPSGRNQGEIIYYSTNDARWVTLGAGPAGYVLATGGSNAAPSWAADGGTGMVASVSSGTAILIATNGSHVTVNHADTSDDGGVIGTGGTVVQEVQADALGHMTSSATVDLDGRYYTETEADALFVPTNRLLTAGDGLSGGGDMTANRTFAVDASVVRTSRTITVSAPLAGGSDLGQNISLTAPGVVTNVAVAGGDAFAAAVLGQLATITYATNLSYYNNDAGFITTETDPVFGAMSNRIAWLDEANDFTIIPQVNGTNLALAGEEMGTTNASQIRADYEATNYTGAADAYVDDHLQGINDEFANKVDTNEVTYVPVNGGGFLYVDANTNFSYTDNLSFGTGVNHSTAINLDADDHVQYLLIDGTREMTGSLIPNGSNTLDLGSATQPWRDIYVAADSIKFPGVDWTESKASHVDQNVKSNSAPLLSGVNFSNVQGTNSTHLENERGSHYLDQGNQTNVSVGFSELSADADLDAGSTSVTNVKRIDAAIGSGDFIINLTDDTNALIMGYANAGLGGLPYVIVFGTNYRSAGNVGDVQIRAGTHGQVTLRGGDGGGHDIRKDGSWDAGNHNASNFNNFTAAFFFGNGQGLTDLNYLGVTNWPHTLFSGQDTTGLVTSAAGDAGKFLQADGTWDAVVIVDELWNQTATAIVHLASHSIDGANDITSTGAVLAATFAGNGQALTALNYLGITNPPSLTGYALKTEYLSTSNYLDQLWTRYLSTSNLLNTTRADAVGVSNRVDALALAALTTNSSPTMAIGTTWSFDTSRDKKTVLYGNSTTNLLWNHSFENANPSNYWFITSAGGGSYMSTGSATMIYGDTLTQTNAAINALQPGSQIEVRWQQVFNGGIGAWGPTFNGIAGWQYPTTGIFTQKFDVVGNSTRSLVFTGSDPSSISLFWVEVYDITVRTNTPASIRRLYKKEIAQMYLASSDTTRSGEEPVYFNGLVPPYKVDTYGGIGIFGRYHPQQVGWYKVWGQGTDVLHNDGVRHITRIKYFNGSTKTNTMGRWSGGGMDRIADANIPMPVPPFYVYCSNPPNAYVYMTIYSSDDGDVLGASTNLSTYMGIEYVGE